ASDDDSGRIGDRAHWRNGSRRSGRRALGESARDRTRRRGDQTVTKGNARRATVIGMGLWLVAVCLAAPAYAQEKPEKPARPLDNYDDLFRQYLESARTATAAPVSPD